MTMESSSKLQMHHIRGDDVAVLIEEVNNELHALDEQTAEYSVAVNDYARAKRERRVLLKQLDRLREQRNFQDVPITFVF